jgi:Kef-type K+ transport system membrane component KefB
MPLLTTLLVLIISARLLGQLFQRFGQPSLVGEIIAGIVLGPTILNFVKISDALSGISDLAVFLIVLAAGLEMDFKSVIRAMFSRKIIISVLAFVIPLVSGFLIGVIFRRDLTSSVFLGLCISITALPVAVRILQTFKILDTDIARYSVATAIFNDVAALLALGVILKLKTPEQQSLSNIGASIAIIGGKLIVLSVIIAIFGWAIHKLIERGVHLERIPDKLVAVLGSDALFGIVIFFTLAFGAVSEFLGFHFVIGAFFGALLMDKKLFLASYYHELERTLTSIGNGFLAPVFFAYLGLEFSLNNISASFVLVVLMVSVASKVYAGWLGGKILKMKESDCLGIGVILNGRGVMELVVAGIGYQRGIIDQGLFSTLVFMGIVTTMLTPLMYRRWVIPLQEAGK